MPCCYRQQQSCLDEPLKYSRTAVDLISVEGQALSQTLKRHVSHKIIREFSRYFFQKRASIGQLETLLAKTLRGFFIRCLPVLGFCDVSYKQKGVSARDKDRESMLLFLRDDRLMSTTIYVRKCWF